MGEPLGLTYFGLFDGHAGHGAAIMGIHCLHRHIQVNTSQLYRVANCKKFGFVFSTYTYTEKKPSCYIPVVQTSAIKLYNM